MSNGHCPMSIFLFRPFLTAFYLDPSPNKSRFWSTLKTKCKIKEIRESPVYWRNSIFRVQHIYYSATTRQSQHKESTNNNLNILISSIADEHWPCVFPLSGIETFFFHNNTFLTQVSQFFFRTMHFDNHWLATLDSGSQGRHFFNFVI